MILLGILLPPDIHASRQLLSFDNLQCSNLKNMGCEEEEEKSKARYWKLCPLKIIIVFKFDTLKWRMNLYKIYLSLYTELPYHNHIWLSLSTLLLKFTNAGFTLTCRLPHFWWWYLSNCASATCRRGWPSGKQRQANRSITLQLCPPRQITDSWILFNLGAMPLGDKTKAALPLRAATLKQQAMITRQSGERQASLKPALPHGSFHIS